MAKESILRFTLDGADYALRGDMTIERMQLIVQQVEEKVDAIRKAQPFYSTSKVAALAALQLSAELLEERDKAKRQPLEMRRAVVGSTAQQSLFNNEKK